MNSSLKNGGYNALQVVDAVTPPMAGRPPLWDAPVAFLLLSLEKAGMQIAVRCFEAKETIYIRGDPDRRLYFVTEGVVKLYNMYKSYWGHKEAIVTLLEEGNVFGEPTPQSGGVHRDSAQAASACQVAVVDKAALEHHEQRDPRCCTLALIVAYAQWVQRNERAMERLVPRDIRPRLAASLLELADRLGEPLRTTRCARPSFGPDGAGYLGALAVPLRKERAVAQDFKQGDKVEWNTPQGKTRGTVKKKLTSDTEVGGQKISASEDDPRYLVESEKSSKEAAHGPDALSKV